MAQIISKSLYLSTAYQSSLITWHNSSSQPHGDPTSVAQRQTKQKNGFEYFLKASGITTACHKRALLLHIAGPDTQDVFETLTDTGTEYQHPLNKLDAHFSINQNLPFEGSVFHSTTQHKSKSIEQFVTRLRKLTLYCEYGDSTEEQIREQVIATCNSTKLRRKLLTESDLTLEKVLQIGQSMEQAQHRLSTIEQKSTPSTSETSNQEELNVLPYHRRSPPKKPFQKNHRKQNQNFDHGNTHQQGQKQHTSNNQIKCSRCGAKGHRGNECRRTKNRTCSKCNKVGHFKRMCRSKEKRHQQNAINSTITELSNPNADTDSDNEDIYVFKIETSTSSKLQSFTISINKNKVNMLIDSGSTLNIIDKTTYNQLQEAEPLTPTYIKVYLYQTSTPLDLEGKFNCSVTANG